MPSLQLDIPALLDVPTKRLLAKRFGSVYAATMATEPDIVTVSIHDLGEGSVWRCSAGEPHSHALIMCDVRRGRSVETRAALARQLIEICTEVLSLDPYGVKVEFTQHSGDEMFHSHLGGFNTEWSAGDAARSDAE
jgi:phenylpyruvate tautomerase PptA (4-oxalocrotonate tautomerase family)